MESEVDEKFLLAKAEELRDVDPAAAKTYILTAKSLFPDNFEVNLSAFNCEKEEQNFQKAAKCFSYIVATFPQMTTWTEVGEMLHVLSAPESEITIEQEFFLKMFPFISHDVQQQLILLGLQKTDNTLMKCKLLLMTFKRFPKVARAHSAHLLELLADGVIQNQKQCQEILVEDAFPLYFDNPPVLPPSLVYRLFNIALEYCVHKIVKEDAKRDIRESWRKIFQILRLCGQILHWESLPIYNKAWGQRLYWDKLLKIVSPNQTDNTQVLFHATTLFIYSLHCYIRSCSTRLDDTEIDHVLVEGFTDFQIESTETQPMQPPTISFPTATNEMITEAFVHAAKCWQLLNTYPFQRDFNKLLITLPLKPWISHFLFDLAMYFGHQEEALKLMEDMNVKNKLIQNVQILSLSMLQGSLTLHSFDCMQKILAELPTVQGQYIDRLTISDHRHMIFLPLTHKALVQYCAKTIVTTLRHRLYEPNCPNQILGDMLILLQLEYPHKSSMVERIFSLISKRPTFTYRKLLSYLVMPDFIEELLYICNTQQDCINFEITPTPNIGSSSSTGNVQSSPVAPATPRRSSSRSGEKGERDNIRSLLRHQITRGHENLITLVGNFITQEQMTLKQTIFNKSVDS